MLTMRDITGEDRTVVLPMVERFYGSEAVDHAVPRAVLERSFEAAADPEEPLLRGVLLLEGERPVGYLYVTFCYAAEVGGRCVFIEEIYLEEDSRGKGYGRQAMEWLRREYPQARRLRLEVTQENAAAVRLYQRLGFEYLSYDQMVVDHP